MIKYFINFFFLLSISATVIERIWNGDSSGEGIGVHLALALAIAPCMIAAVLHCYSLSRNQRMTIEVSDKKDVAIREASGIYFGDLYLIPHSFFGLYSDMAWSLFLKSPKRRYQELIAARLEFPNWVLAFVLYFFAWIATVEGYGGGLASSRLIAKLQNQAVIELAFVFVCSWLAAIFLFHAMVRTFLMIKKERVS